MSLVQHSIQKLNASNYVNWSVDVKFLLLEKNYWNIVNGTEKLPVENESTTPKDVKDFKIRENIALSIIYLNIEHEYRWMIEDCTTASEAWNTLKKHFQPNNRARHMQLFCELFDCKIMPGEKVITFASRLMRLSEQLKEMNQPINEIYLSFQLLKYLPSKFDDIVREILRWSDESFAFKEILMELGAEESRLNFMEQDKKGQTDVVVKQAQRKNKRCFLCKKRGHVKNNCRFIFRSFDVSRDSNRSPISLVQSSTRKTRYASPLSRATSFERIQTHVSRFLPGRPT